MPENRPHYKQIEAEAAREKGDLADRNRRRQLHFPPSTPEPGSWFPAGNEAIPAPQARNAAGALPCLTAPAATQ